MELERLAAELGRQLLVRGWTITTAESCTGGGIAAALTSVTGSSAWFNEGYITYSNEAKQRLLGVTAATLQESGAVSQAVVEQMVVGAQRSADAGLAVAVSGIAGPEGGTADKPVGTVWLAWVGQNRPVYSQKFLFAGDRQAIRQQAVFEALQGAVRYLSADHLC